MTEDDFILENGLFDQGGNAYQSADDFTMSNGLFDSNGGVFDFTNAFGNFFNSGGSSDVAATGNYNPSASPSSKELTAEQLQKASGGGEDSVRKRISSFFGGADDWAKANKDSPLLQMGLIGLASHLKGEGNKDLLKQQSNDYAARQEKAAQIDRDKIAANSASVAGITPLKGIIQRQLQRVNGQAVFQPNGRVA